MEYEKALESEKPSSQRLEEGTYMRQIAPGESNNIYLIFFEVALIVAPTSRSSFRHGSIGVDVLTENKEYSRSWAKQIVSQ